ncbi:MAG: histidinol-phosphate transaminase [Planctomycetes bacterium]|nr:histidinol-phosphate transaminase [Planctomycetota bacterium]
MNDWFRKNIDGLNGYEPGDQPQGDSTVKLNTNENPYPPSPRVFEAIRATTGESLRRYPPVYWDEFRAAAGEVLNVDPDLIVCGNGGDELLTILLRSCCDAHRPLAYPVSTYSLYPILAEIQGCEVIEVEFAQDGRIPPELANTKAALTILCNPNAPTGTMAKTQDVAELAAKLNGILCIDEAYVDFSQWNCLGLLEDFDNIFILRSMSKGYSLAGLRFGFGIGSQRIVETMYKVKDSYNVDAIAQAAATAAIRDQEYCKTNIQKIIAERQRLTKQLQILGFNVQESQTNFLCAQINKPSANQVYDRLAEQNIYVRYFPNDPRLKDKLRITIGTPQQNESLLNALQEIVK